MADKNIDIWNESVYGLVFKGREADIKAPVRYIDETSKIIIFTLPNRRGGAENFLKEKGFNVVEVREVENNCDSIQNELSRYTNNDVVIILDSDKYWKANHTIFENYGGIVQLFSAMKIFYETFKPSYKEVYDLLDDDLSREIFTEVLNVRFKIKPTQALLPYFDDNQYFTLPQMNMLDSESVFVDCGACTGDTVEKFINRCNGYFGKIYAFEPSKRELNAFSVRLKRIIAEWAMDESRVQIVKAGVGSENVDAIMSYGFIDDRVGSLRVSYDENLLTDSEDKIKIVSLDTMLKNQRVDFIKADIEGSEMDMLHGAENIIKTQKPRLAITLYHKLTDYYEIPLYLKSLVPEYHMKIRHHSTTFMETVLYCYT